VQVGLKVGPLVKTFNVVGDRIWQAAGLRIEASPPVPFLTLPISYDRAFGGVDNFNPDASKHAAYMPNPAGRGFHKDLSAAYLDGTPLPNTEERDVRVAWPDKPYRPMAFGPVGRGWEPRYKLAGTYDQDWLDNVFPFLPADFKEDYYQAALTDQQIPYPTGGEEVILLNLTPQGRVGFRLPMQVEVPVVFFPKKGDKEETRAVIDTLVIEPDLRCFTLTWRVSRSLTRNMFEIAQVLVGRKGKEWWQQREEVAFPILVVAAPAQNAEPEAQ
jgi:hypothetical protein